MKRANVARTTFALYRKGQIPRGYATPCITSDTLMIAISLEIARENLSLERGCAMCATIT